MNWTPWLPLRALSGWTLRDLNGDLVAGITLAAIAIPEQMATARLGGFAPEIGFFTFVAGSVAFALFGANRHLSAGADSTITPLFAGGLALLATSGSTHYLALAAMLALMVGLIVTLSGIFRLGWVADLLSVPVTTGFLAGIAVHIVVSQLPGLLGLPPESGETLRRIGAIAGDLHLTNPWSLGLGLGVFGTVFCAERISARIPGDSVPIWWSRILVPSALATVVLLPVVNARFAAVAVWPLVIVGVLVGIASAVSASSAQPSAD